MNEVSEDRFYFMSWTGSIIYAYKNYDCNCGEQIVEVYIYKEQFMETYIWYNSLPTNERNVTDFFAELCPLCEQYCYDITCEDYKSEEEWYNISYTLCGLTECTIQEMYDFFQTF